MEGSGSNSQVTVQIVGVLGESAEDEPGITLLAALERIGICATIS
jgi:hypothetical protein